MELNCTECGISFDNDVPDNFDPKDFDMITCSDLCEQRAESRLCKEDIIEEESKMSLWKAITFLTNPFNRIR